MPALVLWLVFAAAGAVEAVPPPPVDAAEVAEVADAGVVAAPEAPPEPPEPAQPADAGSDSLAADPYGPPAADAAAGADAPLIEAGLPPAGGVSAPEGEVVTDPPLVVAPEAPGVAASGDGARVVPQQDFVKGELSIFLGSDRVVTKKNRIVVAAGLDRISRANCGSDLACGVYYLLLEPQVDLRLLDRKLAIGLGVPLRFQLIDAYAALEGNDPTQGMWDLRKEDYDEVVDFAKIIKYVTYGRKEDRLYVNVGQRYASSVGHGALVRRYAPNIDTDLTRVSAQLDAYGDYAGVELLTNDIMRWNVLAALGFVKPLAFIDSLLTRSFSIGVSAAADTSAPKALLRDAADARYLGPDGVHLAADSGLVLLYGIDAEVKVFKTKNVDIKPYLDFSMLHGGDSGLTLGILGRFNTGTSYVHAFRAVAELRSLGPRYTPSYFDTFYEVQRYVSDLAPATGSTPVYATKYQDVMSGSRPQRLGYYLEGSWGIRGGIGFTLALEGASDAAPKNLVAHLEVPAVDFLQFFGSYYKRGFTEVGEVSRFDQSSVLFAGARLKILPILFVNGRAFKTFQMNRLYHRYDSSFGFTVDLELGYEFDWSRDSAPEPVTEAGATAG